MELRTDIVYDHLLCALASGRDLEGHFVTMTLVGISHVISAIPTPTGPNELSTEGCQVEVYAVGKVPQQIDSGLLFEPGTIVMVVKRWPEDLMANRSEHVERIAYVYN